MLSSELSEIANTIAIYELECTFQKIVQFHFETVNLAIQAIPKVFPTYFLNIFLGRKKLIVIVRENIEKLVTHT